MRICFISPKAYVLFDPNAKSIIAGAEVQLSILAKYMANDRLLDIHMMVGDYGQRDLEKISRVTLWKSIDQKKNAVAQAIQFIKAFNRVNADIYIQRTLTSFSWIIALYAKLKGKGFVYMVAHDRETDGKHEAYKKPLIGWMARLVFKTADAVITQNELQRSNLMKKGIRNTLIRSVCEIRSHKTKSTGKHLLWIGRSESWKRPHMLLKLADEMPDKMFVMVCSPATNNRRLFKEIKEKALKKKNIEFKESVPFDTSYRLFEDAKLFINTSTKEGFPNTFLQATNTGTPIVSLQVDPDSILERHGFGYGCNNDYHTMKSHIRELTEDKKLYSKMSQNAYSYVKKNHDIKENSKKLLDAIVKATPRKKSARRWKR